MQFLQGQCRLDKIERVWSDDGTMHHGLTPGDKFLPGSCSHYTPRLLPTVIVRQQVAAYHWSGAMLNADGFNDPLPDRFLHSPRTLLHVHCRQMFSLLFYITVHNHHQFYFLKTAYLLILHRETLVIVRKSNLSCCWKNPFRESWTQTSGFRKCLYVCVASPSILITAPVSIKFTRNVYFRSNYTDVGPFKCYNS